MKKYIHIPTLTATFISAAISGIINKAVISELHLSLNFFTIALIATFILFIIKKIDSHFLKDNSFFQTLLLNLEESERVHNVRNYKK
ncbi:hypothetical protein I6L27_16185 [Acinetobacter pittii]|uniref:hypothetical protein n=1 Tax=Acinetobacter pittii TaxID=48296 RepID=UPI001C21F9FD|nr:hypothetical protein [Acinetobacter pittii]QXA07418.1 hypothetical protein I6L27_16185 [Acinetobacter pittii]